MRPEFIVAKKEFMDYLTSKRFLLIFGVLLVITMAAIIAGVSSYNSDVTTYKEALQRISEANSTAASRAQPEMPSILLVFESFTSSFVIVGWLLAIAIGFDLISKEKETGSLKLLLARPTYRDSIINGKILGSTAILVVSLAATFLVAIAILLFEGLVPSADDLTRLGLYFLMIVLFCLTFLAIAIAASAIAKNSTLAILLAIGFVVFSLLLPNFSTSISNIVLGSAPTVTLTGFGNAGFDQSGAPSSTSSTGGTQNGSQALQRASQQQNEAYTSYYNKERQITEAIDLVSPTSDLTSIASVIVSRQSSAISMSGARGLFVYSDVGMSSPSLSSSMSSILTQIAALVVMTIAGFAIAYAKFTRMDVR